MEYEYIDSTINDAVDLFNNKYNRNTDENNMY